MATVIVNKVYLGHLLVSIEKGRARVIKNHTQPVVLTYTNPDCPGFRFTPGMLLQPTDPLGQDLIKLHMMDLALVPFQKKRKV